MSLQLLEHLDNRAELEKRWPLKRFPVLLLNQ